MARRVERIADAHRLDALWPSLYELFDRCCREAMHGEMTAEDIRSLAKAGKAHIIVCFNDEGYVAMAFALEFVQFPRMLVANIFAIAGTDMLGFADYGWEKVRNWLELSGAKAIDAWVAPGMARMLSRKLGFTEVYQHMRLPLGD